MTALQIETYDSFDAFVEAWEGSASETRMLCQLLGQIEAGEVLIELPEWLADEKTGFYDGATPTLFVGRIDENTEKAIRVGNSASARSLKKKAHRIAELETNEGDDRDEWLDERLAEHREEFAERRATASGLTEPWLPKSQIERVIRREDSTDSKSV